MLPETARGEAAGDAGLADSIGSLTALVADIRRGGRKATASGKNRGRGAIQPADD